MAKKFRCLVGIIASAAIFVYAAYSSGFSQTWLSNLSTFDAQPRLDPLLNISLSHTLLSLMPQAYRAQWQPIVLFVGVFIAFGGFAQLLELVRADDKKHEIVPFATMLGCLLVPILAPDLPFYDLSVLCFGGLIAHCIEWREHMEWRIHTLNRMHWLCINLYLVLFYFARQFTHPAELIVLMLVFYMRMVEAVRFAAHTPAFDG